MTTEGFDGYSLSSTLISGSSSFCPGLTKHEYYGRQWKVSAGLQNQERNAKTTVIGMEQEGQESAWIEEGPVLQDWGKLCEGG